MSDIETVKAELSRVNGLVDEFCLSLEDGSAVDLEAFNASIENACTEALKLPQELLPEVKPQLVALLDRLNAAKADLEATRPDLVANGTDAAE